ncbi:hypothetical protein [Ralstonia chuxiongensis]|uniref:hypothetical protein n=1 Tax=Ralstonia chuxiongensis TaxID=2957504 RepID=UPI00292F400A|nr:hypothetical protein [Ralstonia chuxiongensis]
MPKSPVQPVAERTSDPPSIEVSTMSLTIELRSELIRTMNLTQNEGIWPCLAHSCDSIPHARTTHLTMKVAENLRVTPPILLKSERFVGSLFQKQQTNQLTTELNTE